MATVQELIRAEAIRQGVSPDLALAVAKRESGFDQQAVGRAGEIGVFQLMPATAAELAVNPRDLSQNISGGIAYLRRQLDAFGGNPELALQAYNGGARNVSRGTVSASAQKYASELLRSVGLQLPSSGAQLAIDAGSLWQLPQIDASAGSSPTLVGAAILTAAAAVLWLTARR